MKEIISIISKKGGVGKTMTAQTLGAGLMRKKKKVLFIDLDSQMNLTYTTGAKFQKPTSYEVLMGNATAKEAIQQTENGDIIPASEFLAGADLTINETGKEYRLKEALEPILNDYDYVVIDTPAALGTLTINALTASDSTVIPVQADVLSIQTLVLIKNTLESVKKYCNQKLKIKGILVTRYSGRAILSQDMLENLKECSKALNTKVFKTPIRECIAAKESQAVKKDIFSYAPRSNAAKDYESFISEFLKK